MGRFLGIRRLDAFGRITIPSDIRKELHIIERDSFIASISDDKYILIKSDELSCGKKVDELFRIVISVDARKVLNMSKGDFIKIELGNNNEIILSKFEEGCIFCGKVETYNVLGKNVCKSCMNKIKRKAS